MPDPIAERLALQAERGPELEARVLDLLGPRPGTERAVDVGCGTGALALALAPHVAEVVGVDADAAALDAARRAAPANVSFVEGDALALPFGYGAFDLVGCLRVLHHTRRPELVVGELTRVLRPGGILLLADQLGDIDPIRSLELDRFERARDPSHSRLLPDVDIRFLLDANDLVVLRAETTDESRELGRYLDLVGLEGEERERVRRLAPGGTVPATIGWYVARKPG